MPIEQLLKQCEIQTGRRSGPGGQHRNKVETAVVIKHVPTGVTGQASERRSQAANRDEAIQRLRLHLAVQLRTPSQFCADASHDASSLEGEAAEFHWTRRIKKGKLVVSESHPDFPAVVASLLDDLMESQWNPSSLAGRSNTSSSQLLKLLRLYPPALDVLNSQRAELGLSRLS